MRSSKVTILIIDDDPDIRQSIKAGLEDGDLVANIFTAADVVTGLQLVKAHKPDVVILDLQMPLGSGFDFIDQVKQDASLDNVKVLLLTAVATKENIWASFDKNIDDFMAKPFDFIELEMRVKLLIAKPSRNARRI